jgi:hypothetical protein
LLNKASAEVDAARQKEAATVILRSREASRDGRGDGRGGNRDGREASRDSYNARDSSLNARSLFPRSIPLSRVPKSLANSLVKKGIAAISIDPEINLTDVINLTDYKKEMRKMRRSTAVCASFSVSGKETIGVEALLERSKLKMNANPLMLI